MNRARRRSNRRGLAIVPAMVCLVLVGLLCAAALRMAGLHRRVVAAEERRMQAEWLAESGLARALARVGNDVDYKGETWDVPASSLRGEEGGRVRIVVEPGPSGRGRRVRVEADYPRGEAAGRNRITKRTVVDVGTD